MSTIDLGIAPPGSLGQNALGVGFRNGVVTGAMTARTLAAYANMILGKKKKVLFTWLYNAQSSLVGIYHRFRFHTSPAGGTVLMRMVYVAGAGSNPNPRMTWSLKDVAAGTSSAQTTIQDPTRAAGHASGLLGADLLRVMTQTWTLRPDTTYEATCDRQDGFVPYSITVWEQPQQTLDTSVDVAAPIDGYAQGKPITVSQISGLLAAMRAIWRRQGGQHISYSYPDQSLVPATTSAALVNVLGPFATWPQGHGSFESNKIPVILWAVLSATTGTATASFHDGTSVIGTLTSTNTVPEFVACAYNWNQGGASSAVMVQPSISNSAGGTTKIYAFGLYDKQLLDPRDL